MITDISTYLETLEIGGIAILDATRKCEFEKAQLLCLAITDLVNCLKESYSLTSTCTCDSEILMRVAAKMTEIEHELAITHGGGPDLPII